MKIKNPALIALLAVSALGLLVALVLFALNNAGMFSTYDLMTGTMTGGLPAIAVLVPLGIGVLAGIAALVVWGLRANAASPQGTPATGHPYPRDATRTTTSAPDAERP
jgi:hypothetical protein